MTRGRALQELQGARHALGRGERLNVHDERPEALVRGVEYRIQLTALRLCGIRGPCRGDPGNVVRHVQRQVIRGPHRLHRVWRHDESLANSSMNELPAPRVNQWL